MDSFIERSKKIAAVEQFPLAKKTSSAYSAEYRWGVAGEGETQSWIFSILSSSTGGTDVKNFGLARMEQLVSAGNIIAVRELLPHLRVQFRLYSDVTRLARQYQKTGGNVEPAPYPNTGETNSSDGSWKILSIDRTTGVFSLAVYTSAIATAIKNRDWAPLDKWMLWASRLLRDAETRCLRAPQHKMVATPKGDLLTRVRAKIG